MKNKTALICGVSGQDGSYLAKYLLEKNYKVIGTSRDSDLNKFNNLKYLGIRDLISLTSMSLKDFRSVLQVISKYSPDEIYNLSGQTSVGHSFLQPIETYESITLGTLNLLEAVRFTNKNIKIYNAGSSEVFGNILQEPATELTRFMPRSPYAVAKAASYWQVENYRNAYDLFACTGLLFNHESILRPDRFVTHKIIKTAKSIHDGIENKLVLGNINIERDWGWAPEYVNAMWKMLQLKNPTDFVIATGYSYSLREFIDKVFQKFNLDYRNHIIIDKNLFRPLDIVISRANPQKANDILGWKSETSFEQLIDILVNKNIKFS
jgi:GDPmannose 4,6-dehydratase